MKTCSVIIRHTNDGFLKYEITDDSVRQTRSIMLAENAKAFFGNVPDKDYKLTFTEDHEGQYIVWCGPLITVLREVNSRDTTPVCFLPKSMNGLRVSRTVEVLPGPLTCAWRFLKTLFNKKERSK